MRFGPACLTVLAVSVGLAACQRTEEPSAASSPAEASVVPLAVSLTETDEAWVAEFILAEPARVLIFDRAPGTREGWTTRTQGARIERLGGFDVVILDAPGTRFAFDVVPYTGSIPRDYTPFIPFTGGGHAVFTGQFGLLTAQSEEAVAALDGDLSRWSGEQLFATATITSDEPIIAGRGRTDGPVTTDTPSYVYVGPIEPTEGESFVGVIDPGLPPWLAEGLDDDLADAFGALADRWGGPLPAPARVFLAYDDAPSQGFINTGSVAGDTLGAVVAGSALDAPSDGIRDALLWFYAHEGVHFFQRERGTPSANNADGWMHEGAASAMANRVVARLRGDERHRTTRLRAAREACLGIMAGTPGATVAGGGDTYEVAYECGALIAEITDGLLPDQNLAEFWVEAGRRWDSEAPYTLDAYMETLTALGVDPGAAARLRAFITEPQADGRALDALLAEAGVVL